jgi:BlaI family transcriptional regulator, penicillinase repressor
MYEESRRREAMNKKSLPQPTAAELELLRVLWERGPSTVREIHENLPDEKGTGYTTTLKTLQIMTDKGLVKRDESKKSHVYRAACQAEHTQRQLVRDLLSRAFGGSAAKLMVHALSDEVVSDADLSELRQLLEKEASRRKASRIESDQAQGSRGQKRTQ